MTATEDAPAPAAATNPNWREVFAETLSDNSVLRHTLAKEGITYVGELADALRDAGDFPPWNLSETHFDTLRRAVDDAAQGDPEYTPFFPTDTPAVVEGDPGDVASPEVLAEYDQETAKVVSEFEAKVYRLERVWEDQHAEASLAKKEFEKERDALRALIRERQYNRGRRDLFTQPPDGDSGIPENRNSNTLADLWQEYPLTFERWGRWGLTAKDVEKLNGGETKNHGTHPLVKFGDVSRFITPDPANPSYARSLKDFKGFGDKGDERWGEAETQFWAYWNNGGKEEFAAERGITADANQPGPGGGDDAAGSGDVGETRAIPGLEPADTNPLPDATAEPKKRKGKGKARSK